MAKLFAAVFCAFSWQSSGVTTHNVTYMDGTTELTGFIAIPTGAAGPLPVVLHVPAWGGLSSFEKQRATRTAAELGFVGFAVSVYNSTEHVIASTGGMQEKAMIATSYRSAPARFLTRLTAAVDFAKNHTAVDPTRIAAAGYCFGGSAVLEYAKHGGANTNGVAGVVSFHGGLGSDIASGTASFGNVRVLIANGAADTSIPIDDGSRFQAYMTAAGVQWEFATYGHAMHGFTHPQDGTGHYHFEQVVEARSWTSMGDFLHGLGFNATPAMMPQTQVTTQNVTYQDGSDTLHGFIAYPTGVAGPLPVILHVHTWNGLMDFERQRATRTAAELGYVGFAINVFTDAEFALVQTNSSSRLQVAGGYLMAPQRFQTRLAAAIAFAKTHSMVHPGHVGLAGYCFGGTAVLQFARMGAAATHGVAGVASFHGGLLGMDAMPRMYCPTRIAIYNGAGDTMITDAEVDSLASALETSNTHWEFTNYSYAQHGFTHPTDGTGHFHYDVAAERRSWASMTHFFNTSFQGQGQADNSTCVHVLPVAANSTTTMTTTPGSSDASAAADLGPLAAASLAALAAMLVRPW